MLMSAIKYLGFSFHHGWGVCVHSHVSRRSTFPPRLALYARLRSRVCTRRAPGPLCDSERGARVAGGAECDAGRFGCMPNGAEPYDDVARRVHAEAARPGLYPAGATSGYYLSSRNADTRRHRSDVPPVRMCGHQRSYPDGDHNGRAGIPAPF